MTGLVHVIYVYKELEKYRRMTPYREREDRKIY